MSPETEAKPLGLRRGNYQLCHGCSNGRHTNHTPVACMCDICAPEDPR